MGSCPVLKAELTSSKMPQLGHSPPGQGKQGEGREDLGERSDLSHTEQQHLVQRTYKIIWLSMSFIHDYLNTMQKKILMTEND